MRIVDNRLKPEPVAASNVSEAFLYENVLYIVVSRNNMIANHVGSDKVVVLGVKAQQLYFFSPTTLVNPVNVEVVINNELR
jgi:hypothetical protein